MPRRNLDEHFEEERPEWTKRKHALLGRYVVPGAMKISRSDPARRVHLVDGYAGPNEYGGEVVGSTAIMVQAALKAKAQGRKVTVHACELDPDRFAALQANLSVHIRSGLVKVYNGSHSEAVPEIKKAMGTAPAIVFLDPQTAAQLTLEGDLRPWAERSRSDILGIFMASQASRVCASANSSGKTSTVAEAFLGPNWRDATSERLAVDVFLKQIQPMKRFVGLYMLRKIEPERFAYGIFGLSGSAHGYSLLSDAVAKDSANVKVADEAKRGTNLFTDVDREEDAEALLERLIELARPFVAGVPKLKGNDLAIAMLEAGVGIQELFGRYQVGDFTAASNRISGIPSRRAKRA